MRWYNWAVSRRIPKVPARVLCNHSPVDAGPSDWIELHPGVTHTTAGYAVWVVPWPGHAGGFYVDGLVYPAGKPGAHVQGKAFGLFDSPVDAEYELLDVPHVEARLYEIDVDDGCVLFQRVEWPESELFDDEDAAIAASNLDRPLVEPMPTLQAKPTQEAKQKAREALLAEFARIGAYTPPSATPTARDESTGATSKAPPPNPSGS